MKPSLALLLPAAVLLTACATQGMTALDDGVRLYREGSYASARDAFDTAVRENPRNATASVTLRPSYAQAYFNRGTVRAAAGDVGGAVTDWQWAVDVERDPWTKAAMRRGSGLDYAYASPPPPPSPEALSPPAPDVRALVARAMTREVEGDRAGAIADLRGVVMAEPDATRRARIDHLLRILEASR